MPKVGHSHVRGGGWRSGLRCCTVVLGRDKAMALLGLTAIVMCGVTGLWALRCEAVPHMPKRRSRPEPKGDEKSQIFLEQGFDF